MSLNAVIIPEEPSYGGGIRSRVGRKSVTEVSLAADMETLGVFDGVVSVAHNGRLEPVSGARPIEDVDHVSLAVDPSGPEIVALSNRGSLYISYRYGGDGYEGTSYAYLPMSARACRDGDEVWVMPDKGVWLAKRMAGIQLGPTGLTDISEDGPNASEYVDYWLDMGVVKTGADFVAWAVAKAAELSGDLTVSDVESASAWFGDNPYVEVRRLPEERMVFLYEPYFNDGDIEVTGANVTSSEGTTQLVATTYVRTCDRGYPTATDESPGMVRPDGRTIAVRDGVISAVGACGPRWEIREDPDGKRRLAIVIPEEE